MKIKLFYSRDISFCKRLIFLPWRMFGLFTIIQKFGTNHTATIKNNTATINNHTATIKNHTATTLTKQCASTQTFKMRGPDGHTLQYAMLNLRRYFFEVCTLRRAQKHRENPKVGFQLRAVPIKSNF